MIVLGIESVNDQPDKFDVKLSLVQMLGNTTQSEIEMFVQIVVAAKLVKDDSGDGFLTKEQLDIFKEQVETEFESIMKQLNRSTQINMGDRRN
jgi:hypothetical protein